MDFKIKSAYIRALPWHTWQGSIGNERYDDITENFRFDVALLILRPLLFLQAIYNFHTSPNFLEDTNHN